jgi:RHS repeat-associated protein
MLNRVAYVSKCFTTGDHMSAQDGYQAFGSTSYVVSSLVYSHEMSSNDILPYEKSVIFVSRKTYEFSDHLGNVSATISDRKITIAIGAGNAVASYTPEVLSQQDYFPFGMGMMGRSVTAEGYRYGFNGMEKESETFEGAYDFGARILDTRLGRWLSVDPLVYEQPNWSPYKAMKDNPNYFVDPDGKTEWAVNITVNEATGETVILIQAGADNIMTDGRYRSVQSWYDLKGSHNVVDYYDYSLVTVTTIKADKSIVVSPVKTVIHSSGPIRDSDVVFKDVQDPNYGSAKWDATVGDDAGIEVAFGFIIATQPNGAPVAQDWSKNVLGVFDLAFFPVFDKIKAGRTFSNPSAQWEDLDYEQAKLKAENIKKSAEKLTDAIILANESKSNQPAAGDSVIIDYTKTETHPSSLPNVIPPSQSQSSKSGLGVIPKDTVNQNYKLDKSTHVTNVRKKK